MTTLRALTLTVVVGAGALIAVPSAAQEPDRQDANGLPVWDGSQAPTGTLLFEQVGDIPIDANAMAFDSTGTLFVGGNGDFLRLDAQVNTWFIIKENFEPKYLLALRSDTLLADRGGVERSLDGGETWTEVHEGSRALYQAPPGAPFHGLILSGMTFDPPGIVRSTDRGDTWQVAAFPDLGAPPVFLGEAFLALPTGHPYAGRLVAAGADGLAYSDDLGLTWDTSNVWQDFRYIGYSLALTEQGRVLATLTDAAVPGYPLYGSDDGGDTWQQLGTFEDPAGEGQIGITRLVGTSYGYSLSDGSMWVVTGRGRLWRSVDAGDSWTLEGRVPDLLNVDSILSVSITGPENHIYIGVERGGSAEAWAWRTVDSVLVAGESGAPEVPGDIGLRVYPNPSSGLLTIEAQTESVTVLDARGREVARIALTGGRAELSTEGLPAGVYLVRAGSEAVQVTVR